MTDFAFTQFWEDPVNLDRIEFIIAKCGLDADLANQPVLRISRENIEQMKAQLENLEQ